MFEKLALAGLKLKPSKCELFHIKVHYLGHAVYQSGIESDPKNIGAIADWTIPRIVTDVQSFLGSPVITIDLFITMPKLPVP